MGINLIEFTVSLSKLTNLNNYLVYIVVGVKAVGRWGGGGLAMIPSICYSFDLGRLLVHFKIFV